MKNFDEKGREIPPVQQRHAKIKKHYMFMLKRDFVSERTIKKFANVLESLKYTTGGISVVLLLFFQLSFGQNQIVSGYVSDGNSSFIIGGNIIDTPMLYENKFTKPKPTPKPRPKTRGKYKKSAAQKIKEALRKLINKKK